MSKKKPTSPGQIALNRKARHEYQIEDTFEAGIMLLGWEVKSIREGRVQMGESHVVFRRGEPYLLNCHLSPTKNISTHVVPEETRTRKLLLHKREISKLLGAVQAKGYTCVPLAMYWKKNHIKIEIGLAKGKKLHDKRAADKDRDWSRQQARIMKKNV